MADVRRLQPHDPVPEGGRYILVLRRFGEDDPGVVLTEIISADGRAPPQARAAVQPDGSAMSLQDAVRSAQVEADRRGDALVFVVDRTAGPQEHAVLAHHGDRTIGMAHLRDTDREDGEQGSDLRDRPKDAGYNLTPHR